MHNPTEYNVEYRNVKHPRLEFKTGTLLIILPKTGWTPEQVLEKYGEWIKRKQGTISTAIQQSAETSLIKTRTEKMLKTLVNRYAEAAQKELNTKINDILQENENQMGKPQPKQQPNHKHPPQIPPRRPNKLHHLPRNSPQHRKKTQRRILGPHKQKTSRL